MQCAAHFKETIELHSKILKSKFSNFAHSRIPVKSKINIEFLGENIVNYGDQHIIDLILAWPFTACCTTDSCTNYLLMVWQLIDLFR